MPIAKRRLPLIATLILGAWVSASCGADVPVPDGGPPPERVLEDVAALAAEFPLPDPGPLSLPRDHGTRPEQFLESWLFAGLVHDQRGRAYGFQLAFNRIAVRPKAIRRDSAWGTRDVFRAYLAVEPAGTAASFAERFARGALGLAGADEAPASAWLEDWQFSFDESAGSILLAGSSAGWGLELRLQAPAHRPYEVGGELYRGYWWPGLTATGTLQLDGRRLEVSGHAMLDRLWGRALPAGRGQLALARVWLELEDGTAVRCEQLRRRAGGGTPLLECLGHGVGPGDRASLDPDERGWQTVGGIRYPLRWRVELPWLEQSLSLAPLAPERPAALQPVWAGVVTAGAASAHWGLLELSNFAPP